MTVRSFLENTQSLIVSFQITIRSRYNLSTRTSDGHNDDALPPEEEQRWMVHRGYKI